MRIQRHLLAGALLVFSLNLRAADPVFPYGAVYFRKSNPPEADWARDHQTAAKIGMNTFRHWFLWSAIEVAPGKYDWRDYDRMMDLAAQNGIRVVIAELVTAAPEWAFRKYPHARYLASDGSVANSSIGGSSATGGFPGLCLDNDDVRAAAERFLAALVEHYKNHPALLGYDLWNENTYNGGNPRKMYCYCEAHGKPFWHAEAEGGPLWMQPQVINRPREDGRIPDENDVRFWNLVSCAGGASGILYPRWRPLLDGPLFGAFGPFEMDGSVTPRAEMAGKFARWANAHPEVWKSKPVKAMSG